MPYPCLQLFKGLSLFKDKSKTPKQSPSPHSGPHTWLDIEIIWKDLKKKITLMPGPTLRDSNVTSLG